MIGKPFVLPNLMPGVHPGIVAQNARTLINHGMDEATAVRAAHLHAAVPMLAPKRVPIVQTPKVRMPGLLMPPTLKVKKIGVKKLKVAAPVLDTDADGQ